MSPRTLLLTGIALISGLGTVYMARLLLTPPEPQVVTQVAEAPVVKKEPEIKILVAARDLPTGALVRPEDLEFRAWPDVDKDEETYLLEEKAPVEDYLGAVVRRALTAGEPVTRRRLVKPGEQGFLAAVLEPDTRAVSVPINGVTGVAGLVFPGDRVDLILTHSVTRLDDANMTERRASETLLENVRILAIDQSTDDQTAEPRLGKIATLEVLPKQAERVILMAELGQLSLSLRALARDDADLIEADDRSMASLVSSGTQNSLAPVPAAPIIMPAVVLSPDLQQSGEPVSLAHDASSTGSTAPSALRMTDLTGGEAREFQPVTAVALPRQPVPDGPRVPQNPRPYTWDSDVSNVLPAPSDLSAQVQTVRVMRGPAIEERNFDK
ncbi:Flp pilus assembly protein CpaB [Rhodovibrionaceae bacterium A322]